MPSAKSTKPAITPVRIVLATAFEEAVDKHLKSVEKRALFVVLADNPAVGDPVPKLQGLLRLLFAGTVVYYTIGSDLKTVFLLSIEPDDSDEPPPSKEDLSLLEKILRLLLKTSVILGVKRGLTWLFEKLENIGEIMNHLR